MPTKRSTRGSREEEKKKKEEEMVALFFTVRSVSFALCNRDTPLTSPVAAVATDESRLWKGKIQERTKQYQPIELTIRFLVFVPSEVSTYRSKYDLWNVFQHVGNEIFLQLLRGNLGD